MFRKRELEEDYVRKTIPDDNGGFEVRYIYNKDYYTWDETPQKLKKVRRMFGLFELISLLLFSKAAFTILPMTFNKLMGAAGMLSIIPWYFELRNVGCFCFAKHPFTKRKFDSIRAGVLVGGIVRMALVLYMTCAGFVIGKQGGVLTWSVIAVLAEYLLSAGCSAAVTFIFFGLNKMAVANDNGRPLENAAK